MKPYFHEYNPWADTLIYLPNLKEVSACLNPDAPERHLNRWDEYFDMIVDAYVIPDKSPYSYHSIGIRYGKRETDYLSPHMNRYVSSLLVHKYADTKPRFPALDDRYRFYRCENCNYFHPVPWSGKCGSEIAAFHEEYLNSLYGVGQWDQVPNPNHFKDCILEK